MYLYSLTIQGATGVVCAVNGSFVGGKTQEIAVVHLATHRHQHPLHHLTRRLASALIIHHVHQRLLRPRRARQPPEPQAPPAHPIQRPLYVSTGSAMPSPCSSASATMEMAAAMNVLPGSPSSVSVMSPFTPPMSPSAGNGHNPLGGWQQPAVPTLHLPGSNLQSSRLRSSLSARDMPVDDLLMLPDFEAQQQQLLNDLCFSGSKAHLGSSVMNFLGPGRSKTLAPSNLDDLFSAEISSSPRYSSDQGVLFSPSHKSTVLNQFQQQQQQSLLSPINNGVLSQSHGSPATIWALFTLAGITWGVLTWQDVS